MKTLGQTRHGDPTPGGRAARLVELRGNTESERWENEGGFVSKALLKEQGMSPRRTPKWRLEVEYPVLISGLLIGFGLVTLIMTIGATREEAEMAAAMTVYGGCSVAAGVAVAATYWFWRTFQEFRPG